MTEQTHPIAAAPASLSRPPFHFQADPQVAGPVPDAQELLHLIALTQVDKVGPVKARNLVAHFGSAQEVFRARKGALLKVPEVGQALADRLAQGAGLEQAERELRFCEDHGIRILHQRHADYPLMLREVFDAPLVLYVRGNTDFNAHPGIAVVGTRKPTPRGARQAARFASAFAEAGLHVVSGLAYGVDYHAHQAALEAKGVTSAILGHGLDRIYPSRHWRLADAILEGGGSLVTEFLTGTQPDACNFPARNRIISGLCLGVVVVEAAETGGALITGRFAFDHNREVYALPGDVDMPMSVGCNRLIRDQVARLVTSPEDVLEDLQDQLRRFALPPMERMLVPEVPLTAAERQVLTALAEGGLEAAHLAVEAGVPVGEMATLLLAMEMKGLVSQAAGRKYVRG